MKTHTLLIIFISLVLAVMPIVIIKVVRSKSSPTAKAEANFTPEQKAVISALRSARTELDQTRAQLEKTKQELSDMITAARAVAISKGVDPNTQVCWLPIDGNQVNCGDKPAFWGFRADGTVIWKCQ